LNLQAACHETFTMTETYRIVRRLGLIALTLVAVMQGSWSLAQTSADDQRAVVEIVRLQHREPEAIRAAIAPALDERGAISQIDNNLILSTSRANLQQLLALIETLDVPRRQLRVSVDFAYGPPVIQSDQDTSTLSTVQTRSAGDNPRQSIVLTEGEYAYFSRSTAVAQVSPVFAPWGVQLQQDTLRNGQSLSVKAEVRGERVTLELAATQDIPTMDGARQSTVVNTALEIGFNGWYVILDEATPDFTTDVQRTSTSRRDAIAVQVELLP